MKYDALIITNIPNYYKINLFNEVSKKCTILVVFIASSEKSRTDDFTHSQTVDFDRIDLSNSFTNRSVVSNCLKLFRLFRKNEFRKVILGEWVSPEYWFSLLFSRKSHTYLILESNIHGVSHFGLKERLKKLFLKRVQKIFASGTKQEALARFLNYQGEIIQTKGVGIINYSEVHLSERSADFLYVGRLSEEKNLELLIHIFNELPYNLTLIGDGPQSELLKKISQPNIHFQGYVSNRDLPSFFSSHRALILISNHEPYGLVAEESIYFGMPVIISSVCGIVNTLCFDGLNSLVVNPESPEEIVRAIDKMLDNEVYSELQKQCTSKLIIEKDIKQIECYVSHLAH